MIVDARGQTFDLTAPPARVVSLVPSLTETLFDLGAGRTLAGVTDFCIFPAAEGAGLLKVGGTKKPDIETIRSLVPDLVHMNLEENLRKHAEVIEKFAPVFVSEPKSVSDVLRLLTDLGTLHGCHTRAAVLSAEIEEEVAGFEKSSREPFTFACPIWKEPWMWCGGDTYVSDLITVAGGRNVLQDWTRYPQIPLADLAGLHPDLVVLPDEPFVFTDSDAELLRSSLRTEVLGPFPGHLITWHGSRTLLGLRFLRQQIPTRIRER